jgi:hypothetical protein
MTRLLASHFGTSGSSGDLVKNFDEVGGGTSAEGGPYSGIRVGCFTTCNLDINAKCCNTYSTHNGGVLQRDIWGTETILAGGGTHCTFDGTYS